MDGDESGRMDDLSEPTAQLLTRFLSSTCLKALEERLQLKLFVILNRFKFINLDL